MSDRELQQTVTEAAQFNQRFHVTNMDVNNAGFKRKRATALPVLQEEGSVFTMFVGR